ncbi:MAG TPA: hypothetical protein VG406_17245 [Isosphaeraceae bacterium]|nr:hypothetical protein [Isosphaeraceae bacterium]
MTPSPAARESAPAPAPDGRRGEAAGWLATIALCSLHGLAIWTALGGRAGIEDDWPLARHDHPLYLHSAIITRTFLQDTGTTAGYDPAFMAGYAKSVVFPTSSTLPEVVFYAFGDDDLGRSSRLYKLYVLAAAALAPWLLALAARLWRARPAAVAAGVIFYLIYIWTDFPITYIMWGMVPYFVAIPLALVATGLLARFLDRGGLAWWLAACLGASAALLAHATTSMVVLPAALLAYVGAARLARRASGRLGMWRHVGFWMVGVVALAANAFWWLPGVWLAGTKGPSDVAFMHSGESVAGRLANIVVGKEPVIQCVLWAFGLLGLAMRPARERVATLALIGLAAAGFAWGYLAGASGALDFLQPGRHTYALYSALSLAAGLGLVGAWSLIRAGGRGLGRVAALATLLVGLRLFGPSIDGLSRVYLAIDLRGRPVAGAEPFLSSRPTARLRWMIDRVRRHVRPGERLLYEEAGKGDLDPFQGGRYSGLIPHFVPGVELLGGPYLHASLATNFTQFGEGKLFGEANWGRAHFDRYARLYRPSAILCWSPHARAFCLANPDRIEVVDDDGLMLMGRVVGFEGAAIDGKAGVRAEPGRLVVRGEGGGLDGRIVLRYHSVPYMRSRPPVRLEPVPLEGDPVPFLGLSPPPGPVTLELSPPIRVGRGP